MSVHRHNTTATSTFGVKDSVQFCDCTDQKPEVLRVCQDEVVSATTGSTVGSAQNTTSAAATFTVVGCQSNSGYAVSMMLAFAAVWF